MVKFRDLCLNYTKCEEATSDLLKGNGALRTSANCSKCGTSCNLWQEKEHIVGDAGWVLLKVLH